jgi:AraC-like DNA-binding protein
MTRFPARRQPGEGGVRLRRPGRRRSSRARAGVRVGVVAVRSVARLIDVGIAAGIRPEILMDAAGVGDDDLRDPDVHLPLTAEIALWQALSSHVGDPGFGVQAGAALPIRELGLLGYVACFSATLRDALRRVQRYGRLFTEAVEFELQEGRFQVGLAVRHAALGPGQWLAQDYRLAAVLNVTREMTGIDIVPTEVSVTYPGPSNTLAHRQYFRCPIHFNAPTASIAFRPSDLDLPLVRADETLAGYLTGYAEQVLASLVHGETMRHAVRTVAWSLLGDGTPSLQQVAAVLRMPTRTLQRRLAAEGTSLHQEIEEIRKTMALAVLRDRSNSIEDVANLLGYAEPSTFFRSFKRWTGTTPRRFRDEAA